MVAVPHTPGHMGQPLEYAPRDIGGDQILARDADGTGRIVEALGDLTTADHLAVIVPGNGHHQGNYYTNREAVAPRARGWTLLREMRAAAPDVRVAVVVWVGYHAPSGFVAAASNRPAHSGARDLARLTHALPRASHVTLVGHSYGTTVCGLALSSARVQDCVALGSPGMGVRSYTELDYAGRLWAAQADGDWIRFFPQARVGSLGLGRDPLHPRLGATRIATGDITGHCAYYTAGSESLRNVARIATGRYQDVTLATETPTTEVVDSRIMEVV